MQITNDIIYVGVNDHKIDLFEGQYVVPNVCRLQMTLFTLESTTTR